MSITIDLPPHILETASNQAARDGISLDELFCRAVTIITNEKPIQSVQTTTLQKRSKFGRMPGVVAFIADDFDAIPEGFEEYI